VFAVLATAVEAGWTQGLDTRLMLAFGRSRADWATSVMRVGSVIGSGAVEIPLALLLSFRLSSVRRRSEAAGYAAAVLSGWALYGVAKFTFRRARPHVLPYLMRGVGWYSFPSGHAMLAPLVFGLGVLIWSARTSRPRRLAMVAAAAALSLVIGTSRVYLGVHWPSDVAGGLLLGTGWAALWVWWWERAGTEVGRRRSGPRPTELARAGLPEPDETPLEPDLSGQGPA
jgi:undecaprenyl-diphosphatase